MAKRPPLKDHDVTIPRKGREPKELPINAPSTEAAEALAARIAKRRGWKLSGKPKAEEKKP
jgi:hypothetical protein